MSKTPRKSDQFVNFCNSKDITSPTKDNAGISKTIYNHMSNLQSFLSGWLAISHKGVQICRTICSLKLHEYENDYYPSQLNTLMESLLESLNGLDDVVKGVEIISVQMKALSKLQPDDQPALNTWSVSEMSTNVENIYDKLQKEYRLKEVITENIAHCRDEHLIEVYASAWEHQMYFNTETYVYLFAEVGLKI